MNETERSRPLVPLLILLAVTLVFSVLLPMSAPARAAAGSGSLNVTLNVVVLGDSYSSGSGAGDYEAENPSDPDGPAYRSRNS